MTETIRNKKDANGSSTPFDLKVVAFAEWVIAQRWWVILASVIVAVGIASGARFLTFSNDYRVFFSSENPQLAAFEALQDVYTKADNILIVVKPKTGDIFTESSLDAVRRLTAESWKIPYATRVDSISNYQHSYAEDDDLIVVDLIPKRRGITAEDISRAKRVTLSDPLILHRLISENGTTTAINITLTLPQKSLEEVPDAVNATRALITRIKADFPDLDIVHTGIAPLSNAFFEASIDDMSSLIPLMYGVLMIAMILLLRSVTGTISTMLVIGLSAATAMGFAGLTGIQLTPPSATAPTIILTIAIADSVHILITMRQQMRLGASKHDAIIESLRVNFQPVFLTSLTTIIGFLSLNFSDAPPFRDLGNMTAVGTAAAWAYSILFLPALVSILPYRVKAIANPTARPTGAQGYMALLADFVIARQKSLLWGVSAVVILLAVMVPRIELNDQFVNYFDKSVQFRTDTDFAIKNLSGIYQHQYSITADGSQNINQPEYLAGLGKFTNWLRDQPEVVHVQTMSDVQKRLNKNLHADQEPWYKLPENRELAAQYLLLFEMSLPYGLDLNNQINVDKSATQLIATLKDVSTRESRDLQNRAETWLADNFPAAKNAKATGSFVMFSFISQRNIEGMLIGTSLALVLISALLLFALRSVRLGMVSLIPNLVPPIMAFGIWAVLVGQVNLSSSVVAATSLGIIVDATVHFLSKYRRARIQRGDDAVAAVRYAFQTVGTALWVTTLILVAGFAILSFSAFDLNKSLGILTAITLVCALAADFLLLPAILMFIDKDKKTRKEESNDTTNVYQPAA
ncbi:MAG: MMPL family transporter [Proteobacteria bacterium]|nr:MMPL family transporter [Pseudomonadota bacterium]